MIDIFDVLPADGAALATAKAAFLGLQRGAAMGDWSGFTDLLADDARVMIPFPAQMEGAAEGVNVGRERIRALFATHHVDRMGHGGQRLACKRLTASGGRVVMECRIEGDMGGEIVANHLVFVFEVREGRISSMYEYATWTGKPAHSRWNDVTFARDAFSDTIIPPDAHLGR